MRKPSLGNRTYSQSRPGSTFVNKAYKSLHKFVRNAIMSSGLRRLISKLVLQKCKSETIVNPALILRL